MICQPPNESSVYSSSVNHFPFFILLLKWMISIISHGRITKYCRRLCHDNKLSHYPITCPHHAFPFPIFIQATTPSSSSAFSSHLQNLKPHLPSRPHSNASSSLKPPPPSKGIPALLYSHSTSWVPLLWFLPLPALSFFSNVLIHCFSSTRLSSLVEISLC